MHRDSIIVEATVYKAGNSRNVVSCFFVNLLFGYLRM